MCKDRLRVGGVSRVVHFNDGEHGHGYEGQC